jgi:hypothetical protein
LSPWLAPVHLDPAVVTARAEALATDPHRMLVVEDVLRPEVAAAAARYLLGSSARWEREYGLFDETQVSARRFENASESDRFYQYDVLVHPAATDADAEAAAFAGLLELVVDPLFRAGFEAIHGGPLGPAEPPTVHAMRGGDYLRPHNDCSNRRRLAAVLYLNPSWGPEHGGAFKMFGVSGGRRVEAAFNRLLLFDVEAHYGHSVEPVRDDAPGPRLSVGWWLPDPEPQGPQV